MKRFAPVGALLIAAFGCNKSSEQKPTTATTVEPAATSGGAAKPAAKPARASDPTPDPITHPCVVLAAQYGNAIDKGETNCATDADCGCYQGGIGRKSGCGGVLNKASVAELAKIAKEFRNDGCKLTQNCAAWACQPKCDNGTCRK